MGLDLSYIASNDHLILRLRQTDWEILSILGKSCPNEMEHLTGVDDYGEGRKEKRLDLLEALNILLQKLEAEASTLPYLYGSTIVGSIYDGVTGPGTIGGIQIGGDGFSLPRMWTWVVPA
jgi:hypothetical protein